MDSDHELAARLAELAGRHLMELRGTSGLTGAELGRRGDRESNRLLLAELAAHRPGDAVLSEESADSAARLSADRVWIVDPLDGTREYGMPGRDDWAVHVALWQRGDDTAAAPAIAAAAVAQPARDAVYATHTVRRGEAGVRTDAEPRAAARNAESRAAARTETVVLVSDSRPPAFAAEAAAAIGAVLRPMGSAGAKAMAVVRGDADAYVHAGGQWEWDSAAPVGVALAAGLHASRVDGSPLAYNQPHPYLPDLLICRPELAAALLAAIRDAVAGGR